MRTAVRRSLARATVRPCRFIAGRRFPDWTSRHTQVVPTTLFHCAARPRLSLIPTEEPTPQDDVDHHGRETVASEEEIKTESSEKTKRGAESKRIPIAVEDTDAEGVPGGTPAHDTVDSEARTSKTNDKGIGPVPDLPAWFLKHNVMTTTPKKHSFYFPDLPGAGFSDLDASEVEVVEQDELVRLSTGDQQNEMPSKSVRYRLPEKVMSEVIATCAMGLFPESQKVKELFPGSKAHVTLHCAADGAHIFMDKLVMKVADTLNADMIYLTPQDLSQLATDYIEEGSQAKRAAYWTLGFDTGPYISRLEDGRNRDEEAEEEDEEDDGDDEFPSPVGRGSRSHTVSFQPFMAFMGGEAFKELTGNAQQSGREQTDSRDDFSAKSGSKARLTPLQRSMNADKLPALITKILNVKRQGTSLDSANDHASVQADKAVTRKTIVYLQNIKELAATGIGGRILAEFEKQINSRRAAGERIMLMGSSAHVPPNGSGYRDYLENISSQQSFSNFRTIVVTSLPSKTNAGTSPKLDHEAQNWHKIGAEANSSDTLRRLMEINFRNVYNMVKRLQPGMQGVASMEDCSDFFAELASGSQANSRAIDGPHLLQRGHSHVWSVDQVHRLVSVAMGQRIMRQPEDAETGGIEAIDILTSLKLLYDSDKTKTYWAMMAEAHRKGQSAPSDLKNMLRDDNTNDAPAEDVLQNHEARMKEITKHANRREKQLMRGVVNAQEIRIGFEDVHATDETKEALKTLTTLALTRPDAFKYGVLANDKISGLLLYGPPGTGKTMLAKAVARQSGATMLTVSGSDIYDMYVGEGEKNVRAVFSLAKKLAPTVIFLDEGDAILGSRGNGTERRSHRELINEFLKEWDGMNETTAFIMVATNRPFDLDDAVLRRLPRKILVDLPSEKDREAILRLHLKDEALADEVSIAKLAEQTSLYSGSDLKNVAVSAALAAVREENETAEKAETAGDKKYPERRLLKQVHFDTALLEISASVNEDMGSLKAIKQFDERYGDGKGRKKKKGYGFDFGANKLDTPKVRSES
jgi:ATP-dependent 26S proteasome regulatory subunit